MNRFVSASCNTESTILTEPLDNGTSSSCDSVALSLMAFQLKASLETLPTETFEEILECVNEMEEPVVRRHRAHFALSLVNHRLRYLAVHLIFRDIVVRSENDIIELAAFFQQNEYGAFVRYASSSSRPIMHVCLTQYI